MLVTVDFNLRDLFFMDTNVIREAILRRPFQPFTLKMVDGREFQVSHPELVAVSRRVVVVIDQLSKGVFTLEPLLIASVHGLTDFPAGMTATDRNGGTP